MHSSTAPAAKYRNVPHNPGGASVDTPLVVMLGVGPDLSEERPKTHTRTHTPMHSHTLTHWRGQERGTNVESI